MPFRDEAIEAYCELVDAYQSGDEVRMERARESIRKALMKTFLPTGAREHFRSQPRSLEQLQLDLLRAFDELRTQKLKTWVMGGALAAEGAVILWLANQWAACIGMVHEVAKLGH